MKSFSSFAIVSHPIRFVPHTTRCGPFPHHPCLPISRHQFHVAPAVPVAAAPRLFSSFSSSSSTSCSFPPLLSNYSSVSPRPPYLPARHLRFRTCSRVRSIAQSRSSRPSATRTRLNVGSQHRLKSQTSSVLLLLPLAALATWFWYWNSGKTKVLDHPIELFEIEDDRDMEQLPGRPGNLTPEQDEKLRKFWEVYLQTCGVIASDDASPSGVETPASTESADKTAAGSEKPKKRLGLFKKKKDKEGGADSSSAGINPKADDPEDKYGENKAYFETLAKHTPEEIRSTLWSMVKHDNPDALMLRFLRARKWDVQKALVMLISTVNWRKSEMQVDDDIMINGEEFAALNEKSSDAALQKSGSDFLAQMRLGKSYIHGVDKSGRPMCTVRVRLHKAGDQDQASLERYTVYLIETSRFMLKPPADTACIIFDMTGFSMANMDYAPVKFMIKCFEANYPESLGVVLVHNSPWVFQGIWKIIRGWLDPVVANKVNFTNNFKDLEAFIQADRIPKELDGQEDWEYKYVEPVAGENDKMKDTATRDKLNEERDVLFREFEKHTVEWMNEADATKRKELQGRRSDTVGKLREQYWRLDPYVRARSLYDRTGVVKADGAIDYYPAANGEGAAAASADDVD